MADRHPMITTFLVEHTALVLVAGPLFAACWVVSGSVLLWARGDRPPPPWLFATLAFVPVVVLTLAPTRGVRSRGARSGSPCRRQEASKPGEHWIMNTTGAGFAAVLGALTLWLAASGSVDRSVRTAQWPIRSES